MAVSFPQKLHQLVRFFYCDIQLFPIYHNIDDTFSHNLSPFFFN